MAVCSNAHPCVYPCVLFIYMPSKIKTPKLPPIGVKGVDGGFLQSNPELSRKDERFYSRFSFKFYSKVRGLVAKFSPPTKPLLFPAALDCSLTLAWKKKLPVPVRRASSHLPRVDGEGKVG